MDFQLPELPVSISASNPTYGIAGIAAAIIVFANLAHHRSLDAFPTVGSWWDSKDFLVRAPAIIQEGYEKYKGAPFKVSEGFKWIVFVTGREQLEELRRASDDQLSFIEATNDRLSTKYTMGPEVVRNPVHIDVIRSQLTRHIGTVYPEVRDELVTAFEETLDLVGNEWKSIAALPMMQTIVCRASNRMFVGLPLCRDPDWIDLNIQYTINSSRGRANLLPFPDFLKRFVAPFVTWYSQDLARGMQLMGPMIEDRLKFLKQYGEDWDDKPNDVLSWLLDVVHGPERTVEFLTSLVLVINFAAIHTSSHSVTQAIYYLAANPQHLQPLREEIESIVEKDGWSKASIGKMRKLDSFLKESQRLEGITAVSLMRKALKDFTFSDGTFIPKGTMVAAPTRSLHYDGELYSNAETFDPFRFADMRDEEGEGVKHQFVSTTTDYLAFGHGKHACPGRFFAANELKTMLAHIVREYDINLEDNTSRPSSKLWVGTTNGANQRAKVMFRRRVY